MSNYKHTWNKWKNRNLQQRKRRYKEETNGNFRTEKIQYLKKKERKKSSVDGFNSRMEETEERNSELEEKTIEITQYEQHRENRLKGEKRTTLQGSVEL